MVPSVLALRLLSHEVAGLIGRVEMVRPFSLYETMVPAAAPSVRALRDIDSYLTRGRQQLLQLARRFLRWLTSEDAERGNLEAVQRRYVFLRLRVNAVLSQFDVFADAISQRSEAGVGVHLAGLDELARDALEVPGALYSVPPLVCYLDRGIGAAIRRARTRLPGGGLSPVAVLRVPRERMVGLGIASSVAHEAGHQGAELLGLVPALRRAMEPLFDSDVNQGVRPWTHWYRWISEIVADLWSVGRLGVAATLGLMNVVSLPRVFVFRPNLDDPHPTPWVRVLLSVEMGRQLYPHAQWDRLLELWRETYPLREDEPVSAVLAAHAPKLIRRLLEQPVARAHGAPLSRCLVDPTLLPEHLEQHVEHWFRRPDYLAELRPCQAFAVAGYARLSRGGAPVPEIPLFSALLVRWALAARNAVSVHSRGDCS